MLTFMKSFDVIQYIEIEIENEGIYNNSFFLRNDKGTFLKKTKIKLGK